MKQDRDTHSKAPCIVHHVDHKYTWVRLDDLHILMGCLQVTFSGEHTFSMGWQLEMFWSLEKESLNTLPVSAVVGEGSVFYLNMEGWTSWSGEPVPLEVTKCWLLVTAAALQSAIVVSLKYILKTKTNSLNEDSSIILNNINYYEVENSVKDKHLKSM